MIGMNKLKELWYLFFGLGELPEPFDSEEAAHEAYKLEKARHHIFCPTVRSNHA